MKKRRIADIVEDLDRKMLDINQLISCLHKEMDRLHEERMNVISSRDQIFCTTCRESYPRSRFKILQEFEPDGSYQCSVALCPQKHQTVMQGTRVNDGGGGSIAGYCILRSASKKEDFTVFPKPKKWGRGV